MTRVAFDPDAPLKPPPVRTVTPSTGLVDGQTVVVEGEHFSSNWHGIILECPAKRDEWFDCSFDYDLVRFPTADADRHSRVTFEVAAEVRSTARPSTAASPPTAVTPAFAG